MWKHLNMSNKQQYPQQTNTTGELQVSTFTPVLHVYSVSRIDADIGFVLFSSHVDVLRHSVGRGHHDETILYKW